MPLEQNSGPSLHLKVHFVKLKEKFRAKYQNQELKVVLQIGDLTVESEACEVGK